VFAIADIPSGARVFGDDDDPVIKVPTRVVMGFKGEIKKLYDDFCVIRNGHYLCPVNFNKLTVSWYLNHSDNPNVAADEELVFRAIRRIRRGEELTADYRAYSEGGLPWNEGSARNSER
jgi:hypothetical protein